MTTAWSAPLCGADEAALWLRASEQTDLRATLRAAAARARRLSKPVAASYTLAVPTADPLDFYAAIAALGDAWYWEQPSEGLALAGSGVAAEWRAEQDGLAEAAAAWRVLLADAVIQSSADGAV